MRSGLFRCVLRIELNIISAGGGLFQPSPLNEMCDNLLILATLSVVISYGGLQCPQKVHLCLQLLFHNADPLLFGVLVVCLAEDVQLVTGRVVGLDQELERVAILGLLF